MIEGIIMLLIGIIVGLVPWRSVRKGNKREP